MLARVFELALAAHVDDDHAVVECMYGPGFADIIVVKHSSRMLCTTQL